MERKSKNAPFKLKSAMKFFGMGKRGKAVRRRRAVDPAKTEKLRNFMASASGRGRKMQA